MNTRVWNAVRDEGVSRAGSRLGVASLLFTFRCTIRCAHCGFSCGPRQPSLHTSRDQALRHLRMLHELDRVIHIAGGECMMFWDDLAVILRDARRENLQPHFVETNCSFAVRDDVVRERLQFLLDQGVAGVLLSADPYHQASVPPENVIRVRRLAREMMGEPNVWCTSASDDQIREYARVGHDESKLRERVRASTPVLVGTAYRRLREYIDPVPTGEVPHAGGWQKPHTGPDCGPEWNAADIWEVHIDPHENILMNCGVILGDARKTTPAEVLKRGPANANWVARILATEGPFGLAREAEKRHGYRRPDRVHTKCSFCFEVRSFLRPLYPDILGPAEIYDEPAAGSGS